MPVKNKITTRGNPYFWTITIFRIDGYRENCAWMNLEQLRAFTDEKRVKSMGSYKSEQQKIVNNSVQGRKIWRV